MAKFSGKIGFVYEEYDDETGICGTKMVEKNYRGDILGASSRWSTNSVTINGEYIPTNTVSIIASSDAIDECKFMKYVVYHGAKHKIISIDSTRYPRLKIQFGGDYDERFESTSSTET